MSHPQFSGGPNGMLIELDTNTSKVWGNACFSYPAICWQIPVFISFHQEQSKRFVFRNAETQLFLSGMKIADARTVSINRVIPKSTGKLTEYLNLEFPLAAQQICALENYRQGGSLKLQIWMQLHIDEFRAVPGFSAGFGELDAMSVARLEQEIEFSQTHWVNQVLPRVGYGKIHVIELPAASLDSCQALEHSFMALKQAEEKHRLGFYDDAVGKCRMALEKFFDSVPVDPTHPDSRKIPVLKKSWERKLGKATYDWLNSTLGAVKDASNPTHHSPSAHYDQLESQMILAITTAAVAYVARTADTEEKE